MLKDFFSKNIWPIIQPWLSTELDEAKAELIAASKAELEQFKTEAIPALVRAVVTSVGVSAGHFVVDEAGKVTSAIPGTVDDNIVNGIIGNIFGALGIKL